MGCLSSYHKCYIKLIKYRSIGVRNEEIKNISSPSDEYMNSLKELVLKNNIKEVIII